MCKTCKKQPTFNTPYPVIEPNQPDPFDNMDEFFTTPTKEQFLDEELAKWSGGPIDETKEWNNYNPETGEYDMYPLIED